MGRSPQQLPILPERTLARNRLHIIALAALISWIGLVGSGFLVLYAYGYEPGARGTTSPIWPEGAAFAREPGATTLLMLAHPRCPCTHASVAELHRLQATCGDKLQIIVAFCRPDASWSKTDLWKYAESIPQAQVLWDDGGHLARTFGAETSGHVVVHGAQGRLIMSGGITPSRGHEGDGPGRRAITAAVRHSNRAHETTRAPVYGCPLVSHPVEAGP